MSDDRERRDNRNQSAALMGAVGVGLASYSQWYDKQQQYAAEELREQRLMELREATLGVQRDTLALHTTQATDAREQAKETARLARWNALNDNRRLDAQEAATADAIEYRQGRDAAADAQTAYTNRTGAADDFMDRGQAIVNDYYPAVAQIPPLALEAFKERLNRNMEDESMTGPAAYQEAKAWLGAELQGYPGVDAEKSMEDFAKLYVQLEETWNKSYGELPSGAPPFDLFAALRMFPQTRNAFDVTLPDGTAKPRLPFSPTDY